MVRSKVKLTYIQDDSARRATYRKRSKGLMKKVSELSTLCGVQACAIVYGPYSSTPEVWPSQEGAREVLMRFRNMPEYQQGVKMANQESFTNERIKKLEEKLEKYQMHNYCKDMTRVMYKTMRGEAMGEASLNDLIGMESFCDEKMKAIDARLAKIKSERLLGGHINQGVEASQCHGYNGQLNEQLSGNQQGFFWDANSMFFRRNYDGTHVKPNDTNR